MTASFGHFDSGLGYLSGWLDRGLARAALPAAIMLFVSAMMTLGDVGALETRHEDFIQEADEREALDYARVG